MTAGPTTSLHDNTAMTVLTGWGRTTASAAHVVTVGDVDTRDQESPRGVLARGMGRSYGDAAQNAGGVVVDMTRHGDVRALDAVAGAVRVAAGITLDDLLRAVVPHGWFLPVTPGTRMITVGGAIAADVHGKNHVSSGSFRHHLRGFTLQLADGDRRWVTPADDTVFGATLGGMGLTGVVLDAELALRPISSTWLRVHTETTRNLDATLAVLDASDAEHRIATLHLDRAGRAIVETGDHVDSADLVDRSPALDAYHPGPPTGVPDIVPNGVLNRVSSRALNAAWFARAPRHGRTRLVDLPSFFHPLDAVADWNRLYGSRGFVQYQFAVPAARTDALHAVARTLTDARCPTFVVVLKRLGPGAGMLSFPIDGWTLAADIPAGVEGLAGLLEACDDIVCEAGGRVYLAKDGRLRAARMPVMYPQLGRWQQVRDELDPHGRWRSDLGRRLGLCTP